MGSMSKPVEGGWKEGELYSSPAALPDGRSDGGRLGLRTRVGGCEGERSGLAGERLGEEMAELEMLQKLLWLVTLGRERARAICGADTAGLPERERRWLREYGERLRCCCCCWRKGRVVVASVPSLERRTVGGSVLRRGVCGRGEGMRGMVLSGGEGAEGGEGGAASRVSRSMVLEASSIIVSAGMMAGERGKGMVRNKRERLFLSSLRKGRTGSNESLARLCGVNLGLSEGEEKMAQGRRRCC